jgi:hypothetical protein
MLIHSGITVSTVSLLGTHARRGIALVPYVTKVKASRFTRVAFACLFGHNSLRAVREALKLDCSGSVLGHEACEDKSQGDNGRFQAFPPITPQSENIIASPPGHSSSWPLGQTG